MISQYKYKILQGQLCLWIHDEVQVSCPDAISDEVGELLVKAANDAGTELKFNMPVDAEYGKGGNWSCTH